MLAIRVEFLHGVLRAGSPDNIAVTGLDDPGEWPPSPARLLSALVAADGTGDRSTSGDSSELTLIETASPPHIIADTDDGDVLRSRLRPRFVVEDKASGGAVHEYVGRKSAEVRPGTRLAPKNPEVSYVWPDLSPSARDLAGLRFRAARVGYLGCADSPVRVNILTNPSIDLGAGAWAPSSTSGRALPIPFPGYLQALDAHHEQWRSGWANRSWLPSKRVRYRLPADADAECDRAVTLWYLLDPPVSGRQALWVTETLRRTALARYDELASGDVPSLLHGHGFEGSGQNHARFLALPDVGFRHSSGRIHGAAVWLPSDTPPDVVANLRTALNGASELVAPGRFRTGIRPHGGERRPSAAWPERWYRPSNRWVAALPVVHERWTSRHGPDRSEVERWFYNAGFDCSVETFRSCTTPLLQGSHWLHPDEVHRKSSGRRPYSFIEVVLDRKIEGPVVVGSGRGFGMGLMAPVE